MVKIRRYIGEKYIWKYIPLLNCTFLFLNEKQMLCQFNLSQLFKIFKVFFYKHPGGQVKFWNTLEVFFLPRYRV